MVRMVKVSKNGGLTVMRIVKSGHAYEHDTAVMTAADLSPPELDISSEDMSASEVGDGFAVKEQQKTSTSLHMVYHNIQLDIC